MNRGRKRDKMDSLIRIMAIPAHYADGIERPHNILPFVLYAYKHTRKKYKTPYGIHEKGYNASYLAIHLGVVAEILSKSEKYEAASVLMVACDSCRNDYRTIDPYGLYEVFILNWDKVKRLSSTYRVLAEITRFCMFSNHSDYEKFVEMEKNWKE